ncbi:MAG: ankyrin repeat domain-containing protein [Alphaproteobacteria bacterium]|nr:MAG: ankyrin repeat domain-containing protein [Alphaproteobacteria bacterium]
MNSAMVFEEIKNFMNAAWDGDVDGIHAFLDKYPGATEITKGEPAGWTALMWSARNGKMDSIKALLERGAKVDARDGDGQTPLMMAAHRGYISVVGLLIEKGADVGATDGKGRTAADIARAENQRLTTGILEKAAAEKRQQQTEAERAAAERISDAEKDLQDRMRQVARTGKFRIRGAQP